MNRRELIAEARKLLEYDYLSPATEMLRKVTDELENADNEILELQEDRGE